MKIKVIKANLGSYWYANNIGKIYDVEEVKLNDNSNLEYKVIGSELSGTKYFDKDDVEIINEGKQMKKSDLKSGMKVITRCGKEYIVIAGGTSSYTNTDKEGLWFVNPNKESCSWFSGKEMSENMIYQGSWDIIQVLVPNHPYDVFYYADGFTTIWLRQEKSQAQIQLESIQEKIAQLTKEAETLKGMLETK
jgi:hypothetical protein